MVGEGAASWVKAHGAQDQVRAAPGSLAQRPSKPLAPLCHPQHTRAPRAYRAEGHDLPSLLFAFLDELLFEFNTELFLAGRVRITKFDREAFVIEAEGCVTGWAWGRGRAVEGRGGAGWGTGAAEGRARVLVRGGTV